MIAVFIVPHPAGNDQSNRPNPARRVARLLFPLLLVAIAALPALAASHRKSNSAAKSPIAQWRRDEDAWRAKRGKDISAPDGWLSLVALDWLKPGKNSVGLAADNQLRLAGHAPDHLGVIDVEGSQISLLAPPGGFPPVFQVDGKPAAEGPIQPDDTKPSLLSTENLRLIVLHRGDRYALRVKDALSPARTGYKSLRWFPLESTARVTARWIPFNPPHTEKIPTVIGTTLELPAPGLAEFKLHGKTLQLEPVLESPDAKELFFILRDSTSHEQTYGAGRFLYADFPDHGLDKPGSIVLDFNRLQNPPCAYTPYATCPLPPYANRLAVAIEAGERRYTP